MSKENQKVEAYMIKPRVDVLIAIPSYKRSTRQFTAKWLKRTGYLKAYDVKLFVYITDPEYNQYDLCGYDFVPISPHIIPEPNLSKKRQFIVDYARSEGYDYVLMIDDDLMYCDSAYTIQNFIEKSIEYMKEHPRLSLTCPAHTELRMVTKGEFEYPTIASHSAFINLKRLDKLPENGEGIVQYHKSPLVCEDMAFSMALLENDWLSARINSCVIHTGDAGVDGFIKGGGGLEYKYEAIGLQSNEKAGYDREQTLKEYGYLVDKGYIYVDPIDSKLRIVPEKVQEIIEKYESK